MMQSFWEELSKTAQGLRYLDSRGAEAWVTNLHFSQTASAIQLKVSSLSGETEHNAPALTCRCRESGMGA